MQKQMFKDRVKISIKLAGLSSKGGIKRWTVSTALQKEIDTCLWHNKEQGNFGELAFLTYICLLIENL